MTGVEIAAATELAAIAGKAVQRAVDEDQSDRETIRRAAQVTPGMSRAAELYGYRLAAKQAIVNRLWTPIAWAFGVSEYLKSDFGRDLSEKLIDVPEEDLVAPKPTVAVPLVQALAYSHDEADLKEMYLNLLAAASTSDRAASVHPSFVEVVKQLSAEECRVLNAILARRRIPVIRIKQVLENRKSFRILVRHVLPIYSAAGDPVHQPRLSSWLGNWERLGLLECTFDQVLSFEGAYDWIEQRPELSRARSTIMTEPGTSIDVESGGVAVTARGEEFYSAIGSPPTVTLLTNGVPPWVLVPASLDLTGSSHPSASRP